MVIDFGTDYPISSAPSISLEIVKGLSPCALDELYEIVNETAVNSIGTSSIHSVVEAAKDWLRDNNFAGNKDGNNFRVWPVLPYCCVCTYENRARWICVLWHGSQSPSIRDAAKEREWKTLIRSDRGFRDDQICRDDELVHHSRRIEAADSCRRERSGGQSSPRRRRHATFVINLRTM